ncbi:pro-corazonin [Drosophila grimshawi]|uniref:Pro-corazonin n=1 Tax=Drosophila grimshawi TaxID=7222 RepID=B4JS68_DROGR|nr:pro-corazonin [Drosophila grimshawi]EDV94608.1 GH18707 [Drosophila grimshawi]
MLRVLLLPLLLFTLSMACMGQTFQYSRGWTNGKRAPPAALLSNGHNLGLLDLYDIQDKPTDLKLERCLMQLQHFVGNAMLHRSFANALAYNANRPETEAETRGLNLHPLHPSANNNNNNENSLFPNSNNHQSNEIFEALAASAPGVDSVEPNDYGKH